MWRVLEAARELEGRLEAALATADLSLAKIGALKIVADAKEPLPLSRLAEHSHCVRSNMTQLVDRLEADGLVSRISDPADRRVRRVVLTPAGKKAWTAGKRIIETHEAEVAEALGPTDAVALTQALQRLTLVPR